MIAGEMMSKSNGTRAHKAKGVSGAFSGYCCRHSIDERSHSCPSLRGPCAATALSPGSHGGCLNLKQQSRQHEARPTDCRAGTKRSAHRLLAQSLNLRTWRGSAKKQVMLTMSCIARPRRSAQSSDSRIPVGLTGEVETDQIPVR